MLADRSGVEPQAGEASPSTSFPSPWVPTRAEVQRGFAAYPVDTATDLNPQWLWPEPHPTADLTAFACPGQYVARAVAVRALARVAGLHPVAPDLRSRGRARIAAANVDIRLVQFLPRKESDRTVWRGSWLERPFPTDLPADQTGWLWVTFYVPPGSTPGLYRGAITVRDAAGEAAAIPVSLRVLDFALQRPAGSWGLDIPGHYFHKTDGQYVNYASDETWRPENVERYFRFLKTRGLNSPTLIHIYTDLRCVDGHPVAAFDDIRQFARAMTAAGLTGELCLDLRFIEFWANSAAARLAAFRQAGKSIEGDIGVTGRDGEAAWEYTDEAKRLFREAVTQLLDVAAREHWPPLRLLAEEEVGYPTIKTATYDAFMPTLLEVSRDRAYLIDNSIGYGDDKAIDRGARDNLRVRQYNNWTEEGLANARRDEAQVWSYNQGFARGAWGFYQQRLGSQGYHQWADQWDPGPEWRQALIRPDGIVTSVNLERARQGLDDRAFCFTLQCLADRLAQRDLEGPAGAAREALASMVSDLPISRYQYSDWEARLAPGEWEQRRWRLVLAIQEARRSLGERPAELAATPPGAPAIRGLAPRLEDKPVSAKMLFAPFCSESITLDGKLDEACWRDQRNSTGSLWWLGETEAAMRARAGSVEEFNAMPLPSAGHAQVAYGEAGLYVAVACNHATQESARCTHGDDDPNLWQDDCTEFLCSPQGIRSGYYHLITNVRGARVLFRYNDLVADSGIRVATTSPINASGGYSQEILIPWPALGLARAPEPGAAWPMNVGREFHSWNQITSWAPVYSMFAETGRWGVLAFTGTLGVVAIEDLDPGSCCPGRNMARGHLRATGELGATTLTVRMCDAGGSEVARTEARRDPAVPATDFGLEYTVPLLGADATWRLQVLEPGGALLTEVPVRIPAAGPAVSFDSVPPRAVAGADLVAELSVHVGDLTAPSCRLSGLLTPLTGRPVPLAGVPLTAGRGLRMWLGTAGLRPGKWTLTCQVEGLDAARGGASASFEVLPSPVADEPPPLRRSGRDSAVAASE